MPILQVGRVYRVVVKISPSETDLPSDHSNNTNFSNRRFSTTGFSQIRRFLIVRSTPERCFGIEVYTYRNRSVHLGTRATTESQGQRSSHFRESCPEDNTNALFFKRWIPVDESVTKRQQKNEEIMKWDKQQALQSFRKVLSTLGNDNCEVWTPVVHEVTILARATATSIRNGPIVNSEELATINQQPYRDLDLTISQIRLFELEPSQREGGIQGIFHHFELSNCPAYIALSYTWGDEANQRVINIGSARFSIRQNLWRFLRQQAQCLRGKQYFWIDAICIDQTNVHERNHQIKLMKQVYEKAETTYIWLGQEAEDSDVAMDYITIIINKALRPKGPGYRPIWTRKEAQALSFLCERPYWRRMWIIQEIVHAGRLIVWCGTKSFNWACFEKLYKTLQVLEKSTWLAHHYGAIRVFQSSAAVMIWQRAHWRHPDTPTPSLQTLIEVFHSWQCSDPRDKVFALAGMASKETTIIPDYRLSAWEVYSTAQAGRKFNEMLAKMLGLSS